MRYKKKENPLPCEPRVTESDIDMGRQSRLDDFVLGVNIEYSHRKK